MSDPVVFCGTEVKPGERHTLNLVLPRLYTHAEVTMPLQVVRGRKPGPSLLISAALHGDELNGIEIIRQVMSRINPRLLRGMVVAAPIVNVFGFITESRYLPDRRDLNRSFPGSRDGSLAARLAHLFLNQLVRPCSHLIDLHTGSQHRTNLPQVRANLDDPETRRCAEAFGAPVMLHSVSRDGSLREAATKLGIPVLLYEAGEPLRFNEDAIEAGTRGVLRTMATLGMRKVSPAKKRCPSVEIRTSKWIRARQSGILRLTVALGDRVSNKQILGTISDPFGNSSRQVRANHDGIVIGRTIDPRAHRGDAVVHLGLLEAM